MHSRILHAFAATLTVALAASASTQPADSQKPLPVALVDGLNELYHGPHMGYRANHAKGILVTGTFTPTHKARALSKAPHFAQRVPVAVRFSDTTGVPNIADASPMASPHGMAIRFKLPDGDSTDIESISVNGFPVATPQDFLTLLNAVLKSGPDAPKPTPVDRFLSTHPAALKFMRTPRPPPQSFATLAFYGVDAFEFVNARGDRRFARYQILPLAGEHALSPAEAARLGPDYLMDELPKRIASAPVEFKLLAQLAREGDPTNDPTAVWPLDRELLELGTITLTQTVKDQVKEQKDILYNPLSLPDGIEPSADPILLVRPPVYAVSFTQRAQ